MRLLPLSPTRTPQRHLPFSLLWQPPSLPSRHSCPCRHSPLSPSPVSLLLHPPQSCKISFVPSPHVVAPTIPPLSSPSYPAQCPDSTRQFWQPHSVRPAVRRKSSPRAVPAIPSRRIADRRVSQNTASRTCPGKPCYQPPACPRAPHPTSTPTLAVPHNTDPGAALRQPPNAGTATVAASVMSSFVTLASAAPNTALLPHPRFLRPHFWWSQ